MKKIFVIQPFSPEFLTPYTLIKEAVTSLGASVARADEISASGSIIETIYDTIETADLVICDVSHSNPNVMYELGYIHALRKPVILIAQRTDSIPFDIRSVRTLIYDFEDQRHVVDFRRRLRDVIKDALENPSAYSNRPKAETEINGVFISYSHKDTEFLNRLLVHLQPLESEGAIDFWVDTKIKAGDKWRNEIEKALKRARAAILLVSADFLASEFIVKNELPPLLDKAEMEGTRIIPVIIKPCRFARDKNLSRFQAINPPSSPLIMLAEGERESVYDQVAEAVEKLMVK
jgi:hypothetical protein